MYSAIHCMFIDLTTNGRALGNGDLGVSKPCRFWQYSLKPRKGLNLLHTHVFGQPRFQTKKELNILYYSKEYTTSPPTFMYINNYAVMY